MVDGWEEREGLVALHQIQGVGWHTLDRMRQTGWHPGRPPTQDDLKRWREAGVSGKTVARIWEKWTPSFIRRVREEMDRRGIVAVTLLDSCYPPLLGQIPQPPWVLYVRGDSSLLQNACLAVVGSRKPTAYGKRVTRQLAGEIAEGGWTVVSGLASGVDGEAHRAALESFGKTVAVMGCGVDVIYPRHHRQLYAEVVQKGAVVSEFPPGTAPHPGLFPQRNRIISGLSHGTLVTEAAEKSGSLITAHCSLEQGREVFAVPGPITSELSRGTNGLVQQGAKCVLKIHDIWEELTHIQQPVPVGKREKHDVSLNADEAELMKRLDDRPFTVDFLLPHLNHSLGELHQLLLGLQVKGFVRQLPGARFVKHKGI